MEDRLLTKDEVKGAGAYHSNPHLILKERLRAQRELTASYYQQKMAEIFDELEVELCKTGGSHYCCNCDQHIKGIPEYKMEELKKKYLKEE